MIFIFYLLYINYIILLIMVDSNLQDIGVISDGSLPELPKQNINISSENIHNNKQNIDSINNELNAYSYVSLIFAVVLIILIGILINDINCKILNLYYNTNKYNDNVIIKMLIV